MPLRPTGPGCRPSRASTRTPLPAPIIRSRSPPASATGSERDEWADWQDAVFTPLGAQTTRSRGVPGRTAGRHLPSSRQALKAHQLRVDAVKAEHGGDSDGVRMRDIGVRRAVPEERREIVLRDVVGRRLAAQSAALGRTDAHGPGAPSPRPDGHTGSTSMRPGAGGHPRRRRRRRTRMPRSCQSRPSARRARPGERYQSLSSVPSPYHERMAAGRNSR